MTFFKRKLAQQAISTCGRTIHRLSTVYKYFWRLTFLMHSFTQNSSATIFKSILEQHMLERYAVCQISHWITPERYLLQTGVRPTQSFSAALFETPNTSFSICNLRLQCSIPEESYSSPDSRTHSLILQTLCIFQLLGKTTVAQAKFNSFELLCSCITLGPTPGLSPL